MRGPRLDKQRAATILAYALYNTDERTGKAFGITRKTVSTYRGMLARDEELLRIFTEKRETLESRWLDASNETLLSAMAYIRRASESRDATPEMVHAIAGAMKIVSEVTATHKMIDLRIENARRLADDRLHRADDRTILSDSQTKVIIAPNGDGDNPNGHHP